ncbi:response regulator transcription factor [Fusicatenibacter saccharivorans]|uniref:Stage 0 sporulation protein A homolog n=2 Tax=Fusicatenibacter saccharivorans TaxID=1150298 RepID=A0ABX2GJB6_9FIRM|nr:response regulator transcription factor [Fusicatenibacter saccharivorans]NSE11165.1 response regulator transcription factor [Fusicatenibacter saccharivorans]NSE17733.1 response regulator transcription factor [Fusicatenibacter saccharivorans]
MKNIFVLVTILGHLPVILSAKRKGSDNMKHILIVEDDNLLNKTLTYNLELDGYTITSVLNARTAAESLKTNIFDLVLLDINLPDGNGYDLCRLIKPEHPDTVVIFLTANDQESNQIRGYEAGAVDYITKPFSISALQRKIKAMFAMLEHHKPAKDIYEDGSLFLDFSEQFASLNGKPLALSAMDYKMLNLFLKNPKQVLTRQQFLEKLWDVDEKYVDEHTLTTSISRIRSKIEADGDTYIKTVYGMGYQWTGGEKK